MTELTQKEKEMLCAIKSAKRFPIARFELRNSKEKSIISTALNNVWLNSPDQSMEEVKENGNILQSLKEKGLINLDYALVVAVSSDYNIYYQSKVFGLLCDLVEEGKTKPDFIFDLPYIKKGMAKLTAKGQRMVL